MARPNTESIAVVYLARGADKNAMGSFRRFLDSYQRFKPGIPHNFYIIYKGFGKPDELRATQDLFHTVPHQPVFLDDNSLDIGAYIEWSAGIAESILCPLNTASELCCDDWLLKLYNNLMLPKVGLVGATASYESLYGCFEAYFMPFPNIHIRSTGFMIRTEEFRSISKQFSIRDKLSAFLFESGPQSMTRRILDSGQRVLLVGRNGRGYSPEWWPTSGTFRQGTQDNLLIADNQTRAFDHFPWLDRKDTINRTWGPYFNPHYIASSADLQLNVSR